MSNHARNLATELGEVLGRSLPQGSTLGGGFDANVAVVSLRDRFVNVSEIDGSYLLSFHWRGRQQAHGRASEISSVADCARRWIEGSGLEDLAAVHSFVEFSGLQLAYERGTAVDFQWDALLNSAEDNGNFRDLVVLASQNEALRRLFPRLGHRFALSINEFSESILVAVFVNRPGRFVIFGDGDDCGVKFEGNASEVVDYLVELLPSRTPE